MTALSFEVMLPAHIERHIEESPDGCWLWTGSRSSDGYGWASLANRTHQAHRLIYRLLCGEPEPGLVLDHLCRVRHCVNPQHLEPVTPGENLRRGDTPAGWDRCQRCGGEFSLLHQQRRCLRCRDEYVKSRRSLSAQRERERRARKMAISS